MSYKISLPRYDMACCVMGENQLDESRPTGKQWAMYHKWVNAGLEKIGLTLTDKPYWHTDWEIETLDDWKRPAEVLAASHWHFKGAGQENQDFQNMPSHVFVAKYIGYAHHAL